MANQGLGSGDSVNVLGNPLSLWARCADVLRLEEWGVAVQLESENVCDPATPGSDQDGDGFINAEELRYMQYYFNDPTLMYPPAGYAPFGLYLIAITSDAFPGISRDCFDNLPTVSVTVNVEGSGSVYLGNGLAQAGSPKTWEFAKWDMSCPAPCSGGSGCTPNVITLEPTPGPDEVMLY